MSRSSSTRVPLLSALFLYPLLASGVLFLLALLTSLLLSHFDGSLREACGLRVRAFLFGSVVLDYAWCAFHLSALFGLRWRHMASKLAVYAALVALFALWIANGHWTLQDYMPDECRDTAYHLLTLANLAALYFFIAFLLLVVLFASLGWCRVAGDPHPFVTAEAAAVERAQREALMRSNATSKRRIGMTRRGGTGGEAALSGSSALPGGEAEAARSPPASPHPLVEILPDAAPRSADQRRAPLGGDSLSASLLPPRAGSGAPQSSLELSVLGPAAASPASRPLAPNEAPSPSAARERAHRQESAGDDSRHRLQTPPAARQPPSPSGLPRTPRLHP